MLNNHERDIYNFIKTYSSSHGYAPSIREIQSGTNISSTQTVYKTIQGLIKSGYLETDAPKHARRALRIAR